jgi:hypothetical protein
MLRKSDEIRNEGMEGVLPTTGSTPSSSANSGLASNSDEAQSKLQQSLRLKITLLVHPGLLHMSAKFDAIWTLLCAAPTDSKLPLDDFRQVQDGPHPIKTGPSAQEM